MKFRDHFVLAARIVGLFFFINGLRALIDVALILFIGDIEFLFVAYILAVTAFYLGAGAYLLRGAPELVRFAFDRGKTGNSIYDSDE